MEWLTSRRTEGNKQSTYVSLYKRNYGLDVSEVYFFQKMLSKIKMKTQKYVIKYCETNAQ